MTIDNPTPIPPEQRERREIASLPPSSRVLTGPRPKQANLVDGLTTLLLVVILLAGAYLRFVGIEWGEYQYLHPDERFLVWVGADISLVDSLGAYFDTANSPLNPHNVGHRFYVYGTLPLFLTRLVVEVVFGHSGFMEMTQVGRPLSAAADLLLVYLVYLTGRRLYGRAAGLLAAAFSAFTVLQIQQSHFFTMDTFITFFTFLAVYFAVRIATSETGWPEAPTPMDTPPVGRSLSLVSRAEYSAGGIALPAALGYYMRHPLLLPSLGFGVALGCAMASKISAGPVAFMLPAAVAIHLAGMPPVQRTSRRLFEAILYMGLAAVVSLVVFRLFQPYAFSGPGLFGVLPNEAWIANIREQRGQAAGDIDFPPSLQWARRPVWFSFQNMVLWGLGLPLGILSWAGFLWAGWRMLRGAWRRHALLWGWVAFYFTWQSLAFNPTMRYQLPVYPALAVFAGWAVVAMYNHGRQAAGRWRSLSSLAVVTGVIVLVLTAAWAYAFSRIYVHPITRVEASRWIYQNVPGPLNLLIDTGKEVTRQILPYPNYVSIRPGQPYFTTFQPREEGTLREVILGHVFNQDTLLPQSLTVVISAKPYGEEPLATTEVSFDRLSDAAGGSGELNIPFESPAFLVPTVPYHLTMLVAGGIGSVDVCGPVQLQLQAASGPLLQPVPQIAGCIIDNGQPFTTSFTPQTEGWLDTVTLSSVSETGEPAGEQTLSLTISHPGEFEPLATASLTSDFSADAAAQVPGYELALSQPVVLREGVPYQVSLELVEGNGSLILEGTGLANEGDWDDGLPLRMDGYDAFGGIYPPGLNFNMYTDDNPDKLRRFERILAEAEYLVITSSRQWGSLPRLPERFPMSTLYYRNLIGCPAERSIEWCYNVAKPGMFAGQLGFELVKVFQSDPGFGPVRINDQPSEEAFTVYDHPKVFIFKKSPSFDSARVHEILGSVDFSQVIHLTPKKAGSQPADLLLPEGRLAEIRENGTWSELFNRRAVQNRMPAVGAAMWYLVLWVLGLLAYPVVRLALPGLPDRGYPLARTAGLLMFSYISWIGGSLQIPVTRAMLTAVFGLLVLAGGGLAFIQRKELAAELRDRKWYFLMIEGLALAFFLFDLVIRLGNPDLWHQWKGGEKPMDFAYLNAVLKSISFPPYDPWYAGGYLNYYYYGFVLVGTLVKWLGIIPSTAYNLIIPSVFMMIGLGAFSAGWNIFRAADPARRALRGRLHPFWIGLVAALFMAVFGNLGTARLIFQGYQRLAAPGGVIEDASLPTRWVWAVQGFARSISTDESLPIPLDWWYWNPSRTIPPQGDIEPITEFPFFTVLYGDPHAHLFALPVALLALAWAVSVLLGRGRWRGPLGVATGFGLGGLAIGALYPINLSDIYTYLPLAAFALGYSLWRYGDLSLFARFKTLPQNSKRALLAGASILLLTGLVFVLFQPYRAWYGQGYSSVSAWAGPRTPLGSYLTHWGLFLFILVTWMAWETMDWMASTPYTALRKLRPYAGLIRGTILAAVVVLLALQYWAMKLQPLPQQNWSGLLVAWLVVPLAAWAGVLLLRPGQTDVKRAVLFMTGTALLITLMVELVVVRGDIGRMNTVFKFYLQAWTLLAVSSAAATGWLLAALPRWSPRWRLAWEIPLALLLFSASLYPLFGSLAKMRDRMVPDAPQTLDGMAFIPYAHYDNMGVQLDLSQDYQGLLWMQENVPGSPVIVEAILPAQYQWFSRFSIYTGLPDVLGWVWHQQQQRVVAPGEWVTNRVNEISDFYETTDAQAALSFLRKYDVSYIIVGQLERGTYPGPGMNKFEAYDGQLWQEVFRAGEMVIYKVGA